MDLAICPFCSCGCRVCPQKSNGKLIGMVPLHRHPVTRGSLCIRGWNAHEYLQHPDRLLNPLIRENGKQSPTSWENAIDMTASALQRTIHQWGPDSVGFIGSSRCSNEDNYLLSKLARDVVKSHALDARDRLTYFPLLDACHESLAVGSSTVTLEEVANANFILVVGADLSVSSPQVASRIFTAMNRGAGLAVIDPRATKVAKLAKWHLQLKPGTDLSVLRAMLAAIIEQEQVDAEFLNTRTTGYHEIKKELSGFSLSLAEEKSGVSSALLRTVASELAQAKNVVLVLGSGVANAPDAATTAHALIDLALATGHVKEGSGILFTGADNNTQGTWDIFGPFQNGAARSYPEILAAVNAGEIRALYVMGDDLPAFSEMAGEMQEGISRLSLLIVQDLFSTELARMANVVLPACAPAERAGSYVNLERRAQWSFPIVQPPGDTKPDWEILKRVGVAMGSDFNFGKVEDVTDAISSSIPSCSGLTSAVLKRESGGIENGGVSGKPWLSRDWRGKFKSALPAEGPAVDRSRYPLVLIPTKFSSFWGTGVRTSKITALARENIRSAIYLNPEDAKSCGVKEGWRVAVASPAWKEKLTTSVAIDGELPVGVASLPLHNVDGKVPGHNVPIRVESC